MQCILCERGPRSGILTPFLEKMNTTRRINLQALLPLHLIKVLWLSSQGNCPTQISSLKGEAFKGAMLAIHWWSLRTPNSRSKVIVVPFSSQTWSVFSSSFSTANQVLVGSASSSFSHRSTTESTPNSQKKSSCKWRQRHSTLMQFALK